MFDILFVNPSNSNIIYKELSKNLSAIVPPTWSLLLAESCRSLGAKVKILDTNAKNLNDEDSYTKIVCLDLKLFFFVVVNLNKNSSNYPKKKIWTLSHKKKIQILVPPKYANAYLCLSKECVFHYKFSYKGSYLDVSKKKLSNGMNLY